MKLIDTIIEQVTEYAESELREMAHKLLHHHGFVKVKIKWDMEWYSNKDETYNLTVRLSNLYFGNTNTLVARIFYRGPKKGSPDEIEEIGLPDHPIAIHPNSQAFPHDLDYAIRYVKSIKEENEIEPFPTDLENLWDRIK